MKKTQESKNERDCDERVCVPLWFQEEFEPATQVMICLLSQPQVPNEKASTAKVYTPAAAHTGPS